MLVGPGGIVEQTVLWIMPCPLSEEKKDGQYESL
jgi:hypothetical protein